MPGMRRGFPLAVFALLLAGTPGCSRPCSGSAFSHEYPFLSTDLGSECCGRCLDPVCTNLSDACFLDDPFLVKSYPCRLSLSAACHSDSDQQAGAALEPCLRKLISSCANYGAYNRVVWPAATGAGWGSCLADAGLSTACATAIAEQAASSCGVSPPTIAGSTCCIGDGLCASTIPCCTGVCCPPSPDGRTFCMLPDAGNGGCY
jgi:hypothetical protein